MSAGSWTVDRTEESKLEYILNLWSVVSIGVEKRGEMGARVRTCLMSN